MLRFIGSEHTHQMALFDDGNSGYESSSYTWQVQERRNFLSDYGVTRVYTFRNLDTFKLDCMGFYGEMEGNIREETQYAGFTHVTLSDIDEIDEIREELPKMWIFYDMDEETLIVKLMVSTTHEICAGLLASELDRLMVARTGLRRSIASVGAARYRGMRRMKEADQAFKPSSRRFIEDWPSVVFEVGVSEGLTQLRLDARFWLECSGDQTRVVILACVDKAARSVTIERWQQDPNAPRGRPICNLNVPNPYARSHSSALIQSLTLEEGQNYGGASLIIPATLIYDVLPPIQGPAFGANDFEITNHMLNLINEDLWNLLC